MRNVGLNSPSVLTADVQGSATGAVALNLRPPTPPTGPPARFASNCVLVAATCGMIPPPGARALTCQVARPTLHGGDEASVLRPDARSHVVGVK
jgi:hypothetical protein